MLGKKRRNTDKNEPKKFTRSQKMTYTSPFCAHFTLTLFNVHFNLQKMTK